MFDRITVTGRDATSYLQAQLSQNLSAVTDSHSPLAAWCTPQGRVIALMRLLKKLDDGIGLVLPRELADEVVAGLQKYRLRADVAFERAGDVFRALAVASAPDLELLRARDLLPASRQDATRRGDGLHAVCADRAGGLIELYGSNNAFAEAGLEFSAPLSDADWQASRIAAGIVDIVPATSNRFSPHMLNLDRLGAVSFDKGCYPGQEIVARTQYRGRVKRRLAHYRAASPLAVGDPVELDGTGVGEVVAAAEREALVLLPVELHDRALHVGGTRIEPAE